MKRSVETISGPHSNGAGEVDAEKVRSTFPTSNYTLKRENANYNIGHKLSALNRTHIFKIH